MITKSGLYLIAETLQKHKPCLTSNKADVVEWYFQIKLWNKLVLAFADRLDQDNPNFKRDKFLKACGMEESKNE